MTGNRKLVGATIADRYSITGEIGAGGMGRVYSAISFDDPSRTVAIKLILRDKKLSYEDLLRFQKEAALMSRLHHPNIICFFELGLFEPDQAKTSLEGGYYIVMEVAQGRDLKQILSQGRMDLNFFLQVGLQVTSALEYTHGKNIIHRDIKPQNIVVDRSDEEGGSLHVKVLDFGIARLAEIDHSENHERVHDIAGTPLYMAPENHKYVDAPVDHRADLYSLGCVLYEILAGRPPFSGGSRDKLTREHAFTIPEPLTSIRPDVPPILNDIVLKLLAKHPDDRYQTAFGLHVDLHRARSMIHANQIHKLSPSSLGRYDHLRVMSSSLSMVGRKHELNLLIENYDAVAKGKGRSRLSVVKGEPGTGKTRLLMEFRGYLTQHKIRFISVSFSRHENNLPFNALANGFNEYLIRLIKNYPHEAEEIKRKVRSLLGSTAELVARVVPGLRPYIYEDQELDFDIEGRDEFDRDFDFASFAKAFSDFTRCLASENQSVVFIFDDMHWADQKSMELIDRFFSHNNAQRFYLILSYRPYREQQISGFEEFIKKFQKLKRRYSEIELRSFSSLDILELTQMVLNTEQNFDSKLIEYFDQKTSGNPLFLVELIRSLVAYNLLEYEPREKKWHYETLAIRKTNLVLDSVDLTLTRIQTYDAIDRSILEVASIVGTSFNFEMLMVLENVQQITVMRALQKAISDSLIIRSSEEPDLLHLGKAFAFSHNRIRESIKDSIPQLRKKELHRYIAIKLEELIPEPTTRSVFTLVHHYNQAIGDQFSQLSQVDHEFVKKTLKYNVIAGERANQIGALVSAEQYFRTAYRLIEAMPLSQEIEVTKRHVLDKLGDILGIERQYTLAIRYYGQLLSLNIGPADFARVSYKLSYFNMLNGKVSNTLLNLNRVFLKLNYPIPRPNFGVLAWLGIKVLLNGFLDVQGPVFRRFRSQIEAAGDQKSGLGESFHPIKLYHLGQSIALNHDLKLAIAHHAIALKMCFQGKVSLDGIFRTLGDHAVIMGYFGFRRSAYRLMDFVLQAAKRLKFDQTYGYLLFQRTLTLDHFQSKFEDYLVNVKRSLSKVTYEQNQQLVVQGTLFQIYQEFISCNRSQMRTYVRILPLQLRTRHWLSPRGVSIYLFGLLLQDAREQIIQHQSYLKRREQVGARKTGLFISIIDAIMAIASGEQERARRAYSQTLAMHTNRQKSFLYPYEDDFVNLFLIIFPTLFKHEFQNLPYDNEKIQIAYRKLRRRVRHPVNMNRPVSLLVEARLEEIFAGNRIKEKYDLALKSARFSESNLLEMMTQYWFGRYLIKQKQFKRKEYIIQLIKKSNELKFNLLEAIAIRILEDFNIPYHSDSLGTRFKRSINKPALSSLQVDYLALTKKVFLENLSSKFAFFESLKILESHFDFDSAHLVLIDQESQSELLSTGIGESRSSAMITNYISSYFNIRSTLFIPEGDAPWSQSRITIDLDSSTFSESINKDSTIDRDKTQLIEASGDMEETLILGQSTAISELSENESTIVKGSEKPMRRKVSSAMNTLIPVKYFDESLGILFLERFQFKNKDSLQSRQDLDELGSKLGLWLKYNVNEADQNTHDFLKASSGSYRLEDCSWFDFWVQGTLRGQRESVWYLGVNLSESGYLLIYTRLNSHNALREELSADLWYNLLAFRTLATSQGKKVVTVEDVYEEIVGILYSEEEKSRELEDIAISFSIFDREERLIQSGHFGPSRPIVLGMENELTPQNEVVLSLSNGRVIRFWKVQTQLAQQGIYILPHDSSKIDNLRIEALKQNEFFEESIERKRYLFLRHLNENLMESHIPRYFVAGTFSNKSDAKIRILDKAE